MSSVYGSNFFVPSAHFMGSRLSRSDYGGAAGRGSRVSYASNGIGAGYDAADPYANLAARENKKMAMQNLNDRLASYLNKVRTLESANAKLEHQIHEWYDNQTPTTRDYSKYQAVIDDLRMKITIATHDNARLMLQIDNARLAAEDFRIKFENELAVRMSVEGDIAGLRKVLDDLTRSRSDLEMQVDGLKEEVVYLQKSHAEEIAALKDQIKSNTVNVQVDAKPQNDMSAILNEIRGQYEGISEKNRNDIDAWYKVKFDELNNHVASSTENLQCSRSEISELRRTLHSLQIELQAQLSLKAALDGQLSETESRYGVQMTQLQSIVNKLENDLGQMKMDIERQSTEYQELLETKTRLELEIAEYRRLLDGEGNIMPPVIPESKPVITQRRRLVIEEIVDGKVVSRHEDLDPSILKK